MVQTQLPDKFKVKLHLKQKLLTMVASIQIIIQLLKILLSKQKQDYQTYQSSTFMALRDYQQNAKGFISGGVAGISQVFVMQPFEIVKVRQVNEPGHSAKYRGFIRSITTILKEEGYTGFYKGTKSPLIGYGLQCSLQFGYNRFFRRILAQFNGRQTYTTLLVASILTGIPSAIAVVNIGLFKTPADHLRILMQKEEHGRKQNYKGQLQAAKDIFKRHGIRGLYLGFKVTLFRQLLAMGLYFSSFQTIKQHLQHDREGSWREKIKLMLAGSAAGLISWVVGYPLDFIKTKIQSQDLDNKIYKGIIDCLKTNVREHGKRILTRGLTTVCIRSIPVNSVAFLVEEQMGILLKRKHIDEFV